MGIFIREGADPLSERSLASPSESVLIQAPSDASRVLRQELERYCAGNVSGRSFLIAGHRGAGKTTMISAAIDAVLRTARFGGGHALLRPLPVFLHGPSLFSPTGASAASGDLAEQAKEALVQVILGLHREAVGAFMRAYRQRASGRSQEPFENGSHGRTLDAFERAAQFEIEVLEDPPAARLREFWDHADALQRGVLFAEPRGVADQGMRELVALNGLCNAHQRISGDLQAKDSIGREQKTEVLPSSLARLRGIELVKPVAAMFAGTAVAAGGAVGSQTLLAPALLGVLAAGLTTLLFESGGQTTEKRGRQLDTTFIPDLSLKTLDRVLPTLLQRLRDAGLAPVLVIDELDKVRELPERLQAMIHFLKKLVAEKAFTCFLTDRSYLEHLRITGRGAAYGLAYSYFSHPLLVAHRPRDFEQYLDETLKPENTPTTDPADVIDQQVLSWVLRHRSQLHALALQREVAALRGDDGRMRIPRGYVISEITYLMDVTLQFAIELRLREPRVIAWQRQHVDMIQVLHDALYFLSRQWLDGEETIRIDDVGKAQFFKYLVNRMNLDEVRSARDVVGGDAAAPPFSGEDQSFLFGLVEELVKFLGTGGSVDDARAAWASLPVAAPSALPEPPVSEAVWSALQLGPEYSPLEGTGDVFKWRYEASGKARVAGTLFADASKFIGRIGGTDERLRAVLGTPEVESGGQKPAFALLAEEWRILPTTPAWSRVAKAIESLKAKIASPSITVSDEDCRVVIAFGEMLRANDLRLVEAIAQASVLAGLAQPLVAAAIDAKTIAPDPQALRRALQVLSEGLQFSTLDASAFEREMAALSREIEQDFGVSLRAGLPTPAYVPSKVPGVAATRIRWVVRDGVAHGVELARRADAKRAATLERAWLGLHARLAESPGLDVYAAANASEIVAALWQAGPTVVLPLNLRSVTLAGWSRAALAAFGFALPAAPAPAGASVPLWLAYLALEPLGAGNLRPDVQSKLIDRLRIAAQSSPQPSGAGVLSDINLVGNLQKTRPWRGTANQSRIVVLFLNRTASACRTWSVRPTLGLVASIDLADADAALQLLGGTAATVMLAAEQPSSSPTPEQMTEMARSWQGGVVPVWLWVGEQSTATRTVVTMQVASDPQGPDDLLAHVPAMA